VKIVVATHRGPWVVDPGTASMRRGEGMRAKARAEDRSPDAASRQLTPTCVAWDGKVAGRAWAGTDGGGVFRSDDGGVSWQPVGLSGERISSITASRAAPGELWVGAEPSRIWRTRDAGTTWQPTSPLEQLPSSPRWAFPPRPSTHHVRWIACHPRDPETLWAAIEAGALVASHDGGTTWTDRVPGGPKDTHELAIHPDRPEHLRSAAGDGWFESTDGGATWESPEQGLEVRYLRSVAIDPGDPAVVLVSGASGPRTAYGGGRADGRVWRRQGSGAWRRVLDAWPDPPATIAPILRAGATAGELWAVDERGVHRSADGGFRWERTAAFPEPPQALRGLAVQDGS
jgi:photosystem II stability/assembly factor-like uncharacterized protein